MVEHEKAYWSNYAREGRRDGKRYDMFLYGLLRPEWESHQHSQTPQV